MSKEALTRLKQMALDEKKRLHPTLPPYALYVKPYSDKTANQLTRAIIDFLRLKGHQAERIAVMGRYIDNSKVVTDVIGTTRRIGSGKWIPGSMQKGSADISAIVNGRPWKIEVKIGKDRQSEDQKNYQCQVEKAGGYYSIVKSFEEFFNQYSFLTIKPFYHE